MSVDLSSPTTQQKSDLKFYINKLALQNMEYMFPDATVNNSLNDALTRAQASNGILYVPPGTWSISAKSITSSISFVGVPGLSVLTVANDLGSGTAGIYIDFTGSTTTEQTLTSFTDNSAAFISGASRDVTLKIVANDFSSYQEGDIICIYSKTATSPYDLGGGSFEYLGEALTVEYVDTTTTGAHQLWTRGRPLQSNWFTAQTPSTLFVRRLSRNTFNAQGIKFIGTNNRTFTGSTSKRSPLLELRGVVRGSIDNCEFEGGYAQGIKLTASSLTRITNTKIRNLLNYPGMQGYGYGIDIYGMCYGTSVRGIQIERGRHALTTNSLDTTSTPSSNWYFLGGPTGTSVMDLQNINGDGNSIDTHQTGWGFTFQNCNDINPQEDYYNTTFLGTYTQSGTTTVTVTVPGGHGLSNGGTYWLYPTSGTTPAILATIIVSSSTVFTYTATVALTTSGNINIAGSTIKGKGVQIRAPGTILSNFIQHGGTNSISMQLWADERDANVVNDPRSVVYIDNSIFNLAGGNTSTNANLSGASVHLAMPTNAIVYAIPVVIRNTTFSGGTRIIDQSGSYSVNANITFINCTFTGTTSSSFMFLINSGKYKFINCIFDMRLSRTSQVPFSLTGSADITLIDCFFDWGSVAPANAYLISQGVVGTSVKHTGTTVSTSAITAIRNPSGAAGTIASITTL